MAMEKFVLASDVGGLSEMVIPKVSGDLFKADSIGDLIKKINYYQKNQKIRDKIRKKARIWVRNNKDWRVNAKKYKKIYSQLLRSK